jgi:predicted AAA+ superfamily ATPase
MYKRKIIDKIKIFLKTNDILLFYWARQVGKTSLMRYIQNNFFKENSIFIDLEKESNLDLLNKDADIFIEYLKSYHWWKEQNKIVIFIDEIQYLDNPTSFLKYIYDSYKNIKLIISWSSTLEIRWKLKDSLVGRIIKFDIYPLSFEEFLIFKNKNKLLNILWKKNKLEIIDNEFKFLFEEYIKFWWYPKIVLSKNMIIKKEYLKQIYNTYIEKDIKDIWKIKEVKKFNKLIKILAIHSWNLLNISELSNSIWATIKTINNWLFLLENTFVIKLSTPFSNNIRWELTKMPKIFFIDNGIRNFISDNYRIECNSFETSIFNYINNSYKSQNINFYRTQDQKEIDFILDWIPYEVKINYNYKKLTALDFFEKKYKQSWNVISLNKQEKNSKYNIFYPWEL